MKGKLACLGSALPVVTVVFALAGCGTVGYTAPSSGPTATISFVNYASRNLEVAIYEKSEGCVGRRHVPVIAPPNQAEHVVRAGSELTFQYYLTNFGGPQREEYCLMNLRFVPKEGARYLFRTEEDPTFCKWAAFDVTDPRQQVKIELKQVPWKAGWDENSSFCAK